MYYQQWDIANCFIWKKNDHGNILLEKCAFLLGNNVFLMLEVFLWAQLGQKRVLAPMFFYFTKIKKIKLFHFSVNMKKLSVAVWLQFTISWKNEHQNLNKLHIKCAGTWNFETNILKNICNFVQKLS